jgi:hypothetical protein
MMMDGGPSCPAGTTGCPCDNGSCLAGGVCGANDECRAPIACEAAGCVANQVCTPSGPGTDAVCEDACDPGYTWNGSSCVADVNANCDVTDAGSPAPGSIADDCTNQNRECDAGPPATCGDCLAGNLEHEGICEAPYQCSNLNCASTNEECIEGDAETDAECGNCLAGYYRNAMGVCVLGASCTPGAIDDITASCTAQNRVCDDSGAQAQCGDCVDATYVDLGPGPCEIYVSCQDATLAAQCAVENRNCEDTLQGDCTTCLDNYIEADGNCLPTLCTDFDDSQCMSNQTCQDGDVVTNTPASCGGDACLPNQALNTQNGSCVACDCWEADGTMPKAGLTGVRYPEVSAQGECFCETEPGWFFDGTNAQRCDLDEDGWVRQSARAFMLWPEGDVRREAAKCGAPSGNVYAVPTISSIRMVNELGETKTVAVSPAVEAYESDRNDDQARIDGDASAPSFGAAGRRPAAAELNSLTKACVQGADYNDNEAADTDEYQGQSVTSTLAGAQTFTRYSYFTELATGRFDLATPATYVIEERPRAGVGSVPLHTDGIDVAWQSCSRRIDAYYAASLEQARTNDFASVQPCGYGMFGVCAGGDSPRFVGMTHHSQFKCLTVSTAIDTSPHTIDPTAFSAAGHWMNDCSTPAVAQGESQGAGQPVVPPVVCSSPATQTPANNVSGFAVVGFDDYPDEASYVRGCVNECREGPDTCPHCDQTGASCSDPIACQYEPMWGDFVRCDCPYGTSVNPDNGACEAQCGDEVLADHLPAQDPLYEECDLGDGNSDTDPDTCRLDCTLPICGDGVTDPSNMETCDEGTSNSDEPDEACRLDCLPRRCGDGIVDPVDNEECDEGVANSDAPDQACREDCLPQRCGDGIVDPGANEDCDLGAENGALGSPCSSSCLDAPPTSCLNAMQVHGVTTDGVITIDPDGEGGAFPPFPVYCDMTTDGGGWTLVARASAGSRAHITDANDVAPDGAFDSPSEDGKLSDGKIAALVTSEFRLALQDSPVKTFYEHLPMEGFENVGFCFGDSPPHQRRVRSGVQYPYIANEAPQVAHCTLDVFGAVDANGFYCPADAVDDQFAGGCVVYAHSSAGLTGFSNGATWGHPGAAWVR